MIYSIAPRMVFVKHFGWNCLKGYRAVLRLPASERRYCRWPHHCFHYDRDFYAAKKEALK